MLRVLRERFIGLGRDEDGAALVITLAVFMFIYLLFIGIWAVGTNVRTRIHLQNACDAAAYSAAVVQADTLSRIATINRAMSWTYVQMTKHQQDYILWKLMKAAYARYLVDAAKADWIGADGNTACVKINEKWVESIETLATAVNDSDKLGLKGLLDTDHTILNKMDQAQQDLADALASDLANAAKNICMANVENIWKDDVPDVRVEVVADWSRARCLRVMNGSEEPEFRSYAGDDFVDYDWLPYKNDNTEGIGREYAQQTDRLRVDWSWYTITRSGKSWNHPTIWGSDVKDGYFGAFRAKPKKLELAYFGKDGTITVGLKAKNQNPWGWMGDVSKGIFSAFDPFVTNTFCVASAKAGYRDFGAGKTYGRDYQIDWRSEERWNLYTSDWDAVLVPVPRAASMAQGGVWENDVGDEMPDALSGIAGKLGFSASDFRAGGQHDYLTAFSQDGYSWDEYLDLSNADYVKAGGAVRAKWQVRNPGGVLGRWEKIQKRMWH